MAVDDEGAAWPERKEPALVGEQYYRSLFEHSRSVMLLIEPVSGAIVDANQAAAAFYGWSRADLRKMNIYAINTLPKAAVWAEMDRAQQEQRSHFQFRHRRADGSIRDVEVYSGPVEVNSRPHLHSIVHDVTERKQAEAALLRSQVALKRSQALAHVGHWTWDVATRHLSCSEEMLRIFALDPNIDHGELHLALEHAVHPDDRPTLRRLWARVRDELAGEEAEYRVVWPDGSIHFVSELPAERTCNAAGDVVELTGVVQDITERKWAEQVHAQFARQERLAAVGQLAAGIAHDFNNILSVVGIYAELTSEAAGLTTKERARLNTIVEQTERASLMIRQMLDFSRQAPVERLPLDLLPLLKEQCKFLRQTLPESLELELHYREGEYWVRADPTRIQQLVMNLVVNARDAMPHGGRLSLQLGCGLPAPAPPPCLQPELPPSLAAALEIGAFVRLEVEDSGEGMSPEVLSAIFAPFFTTKTPDKGTGLGLPQVQGIVAQHDGHIAVASREGVGTSFHVYLPAHVPPGGCMSATGAQQPLPMGKGEVILLVEDDAVLRKSLADLVGQLNYQVVTAANGEEALALLVRTVGTTDLIVSDVVMPRLGGLGLAQALRRLGIDTPIILLSGHAVEEMRRSSDAGLALAWMEKPPSREALANTIAQALARKGSYFTPITG